jgi:hypothetical protein
MSKLIQRDRAVIADYLAGMPYKVIARRHNLTPSQVQSSIVRQEANNCAPRALWRVTTNGKRQVRVSTAIDEELCALSKETRVPRARLANILLFEALEARKSK